MSATESSTLKIVALSAMVSRLFHRRTISMMSDPHDDEPIRYMQRTRDWYLALGYRNPYRWAHFDDVPFTPLAKPLAQCTVALITTAAPSNGARIPGRSVFDASAKFFRVYSGETD